MKNVLTAAVLGAVVFVAGGGGSPAAAATLKLATLVPDGSVWDTALTEMGADWQEATDGRVSLRIYPGGVAGDERDVVRKMRIGQLQAATLTTTGLAEIDSGFDVFGLPMLIGSYDELEAVLEEMGEEFAARLDAKGFVLLHWGHGGWTHLFSKKPIRSVADLKKQKLFVWAGDDERVQQWRREGFQPVPLAATDIMTGLQTGLIDALPTTPLAALSLQWYRQTPYMLDVGLAPLVGATVISKPAWNRLSAADRAALRKAAQKTEARLRTEVAEQDRRAIAEMEKRGLERVAVPVESWRAFAEEFSGRAAETIVDGAVLGKVVAARDRFRAAEGDG